MEDLSGKQLGKYQVVTQLGAGGMATVYKAYQSSMERYVALKILPRHLAAESDFVNRFKNESKVIASLEHPNILPVHDFGENDGYTYLVMRFVEDGQNLSNLLQGQPLPFSQIQHLIGQISSGLDYAHSRSVIHRDVKPSNVLLDERGNCLLSDFGLAKVLISSSLLTASGVFLGTPTYASPEQCLGRSDIDQRSDIYSLGVILYEMATGRPPFDADTPMGVVIKHIHDPLPMPRAINANLPDAVERVILKALSKERDGRYSTADELAQAFFTAVDGLAENTGSPLIGLRPRIGETQPAIEPPERRIRKIHKKWIAAGILGLILLFVCTTGSLWGMYNFIYPTDSPAQSIRISSTIEVLPTQTDTPPPPTPTPTTIPSSTQTQVASPTQRSSETPSPTIPLEGFLVTARESVIVRSGPELLYRWVEGSPYSKGTEFLIKGRSEDGEWFFVILPYGHQGWVHTGELPADFDWEKLPIVEAPPTPVPLATSTKTPRDTDEPKKGKTQKPTNVPPPDPTKENTPEPTDDIPPPDTPYP